MARIDPYKLTPVPPVVALLRPDSTALTEHGELCPLEGLPKGVRVYGSWDQVDELLRAGVGETYCWDGEPIRWRHRAYPEDISGWQRRASDVTVFRLAFPGEREALEALILWRDWLGRYGAAPQGSLGSSAMSLLCATLERSLWTARGELPPIRWTLGGRQELAVAPRSTLDGCQHFDLPAAYASVLGQLRYGGVWREVDGVSAGRHSVGWWCEGGRPVFARAVVRVPEVRFGPLPRRPRHAPSRTSWDRDPVLGGDSNVVVFPTGARLVGTWTGEELVEAERAGCAVRVESLWLHVTEDSELGQPFLPWWRAVVEGRAMPGFASTLAKASANACWGQFCISSGRREVVTVVNGQRHVKPIFSTGDGMPRSWDLAELVTGRVRARLAGMMRVADGSLVSVHTDGGWLRDGPAPPDGWLVKDTAKRLDILGPQMLRYQRPRGDGGWLHCVSGVPARRAAERFDSIWEAAK